MQLNKNSNWSIFIIAFIVFIIWQSPSLGIIRYPFILLGTWFHEMGHGLTALILGGHFNYLEIYNNGGGTAYTSYNTENLFLPYNITRALVAVGGLLGPCFVGAALIISAVKNKWALWTLRALIIIMILSLIIWVRSGIGIAILALISLLLIGILYSKKTNLITWSVLFLGLQSTLSTYLQLDYLFTGTFVRDGAERTSDTQQIANNLFGSYWFWAFIIIIISAVVLWKSYSYYLRKAL